MTLTAIVDYVFYTSEYYGDAPEVSFDKVLSKAEMKFNRLTFNHIVCVNGEYGQMVRGTFEAFNEQELRCVKMAVCSLIDSMMQFEAIKKQALSGTLEGSSTTSGRVRSVSSGGESITYGDKATSYDAALTSTAAENNIYKESMMEYMQPEAFRVNPFYAGV